MSSQRSTTESDVIVGMIDTGIWPESASFDDTNFGAPPTKWKGTCKSSSNFTCNNKIIGARYYHSEGSISPPDLASPRDTEGHGTHTASTAAGSVVNDASMLGLALGTACGAVPSSRIAVYKVCWSEGCSDADLLAAFDDAIADVVDIISISIGGFSPSDYFDDPIAVGAFHAMKKGILTSNSAGNSGPEPQSIVNFSPWSLSVAASVIDRKFLTKVQLGNTSTYEGQYVSFCVSYVCHKCILHSIPPHVCGPHPNLYLWHTESGIGDPHTDEGVTINTFTLKEENYPLVYGGDVPAAGVDSSSSRFCEPDSLDPKLVNGTIVLCDSLNDATGPADAGAIGTIMSDDFDKDFALSFPISASYLNTTDGSAVLGYINQTSKPTATIFKSSEVKETLAPFVVSFSARGPNPITRDILKPDLTAPGVDILAAWSEASSPTELPEDSRVVPFNIISGTSMSCPHASGAAAYVKSFNTTWSPSAIKSALMTTAAPMTLKSNEDGEFAYGSGHIDPVKAKSPGLVYDISEADCVSFLCGQGYSNKNLQLVTRDNATCTSANNSTVYDLNYLSFTISGKPSIALMRIFHRTVTNVGSPSSTYKAVVTASEGLGILVKPDTLSFQSLGETQTFVVIVSVTVSSTMLQGLLVWDDGVYQVRSPAVAYAV